MKKGNKVKEKEIIFKEKVKFLMSLMTDIEDKEKLLEKSKNSTSAILDQLNYLKIAEARTLAEIEGLVNE